MHSRTSIACFYRRLPQYINQLSSALMFFSISLSIVLLLQSHVDRGHLHYELNQEQYILSGVFYLCLITIYSLWLLAAIRADERDRKIRTPYQIILAGSPFLLAAFLAFPNTSDIFTYLQSGAMVLDGTNPYLVPAGSFSSPFSPYLKWYQTSTYGPVSQLFFALAALFANFGPMVAVYCFKVFCLSFHLLSTLLIWNLAENSPRRSLITFAYLINPILLFEYVKQAHVDAILNFIVVLAIFCVVRKRFFLSGATLLLGILSKTLPVIWLPLLWVHLFRGQRWKSLTWCVSVTAGVVFLLSITVLPTAAAWISLLNPGVAWQSAGSIHNLLDTVLYYATDYLPSFISEKRYRLTIPFKILTYGAYLVYFTWLLVRYLREYRDEKQLVLDMGWSALILFLFATPWDQPWYSAIFISFAAIFTTLGLNKQTMLFSVTGLIYCVCNSSYYVLAFPNATRIELAAVSLITVVPALFVMLLPPKGFSYFKEYSPDA